MDNTQPMKRPLGMTILLVLSLANACLQIFSNLFIFISLPVLKENMENGEFETALEPLQAFMDEASMKWYMDMMDHLISIDPLYFLLTGVLFIGSLVGVIKMFKLQRLGFHIYSISQMLLLIVSVIFIHSTIGSSGFFNEFLFTLMFILLYHLYLKRFENGQETKREQDF